MKKFLKWLGIILGSLIVLAFFGFLYFIPPFTLAPPEEFSTPETNAPPSLEHITDTKERMIAERGKYLVTTTGCTGCHTPQGDKGPEWDRYLSGGNKFGSQKIGTFTTRNLTPDMETGIGSRSDEEIMNVLRSGVFHTGRIINHRAMPWTAITNLSEEDRYAIVKYLRYLKPVAHKIPDQLPPEHFEDTKAVEIFVVGDFGEK
ncbi:MAG: c-type cytochrome [Ignavibacteriales bacterium]|nr:c-type cytochrome [Ignavibacteriales bacterium]